MRPVILAACLEARPPSMMPLPHPVPIVRCHAERPCTVTLRLAQWLDLGPFLAGRVASPDGADHSQLRCGVPDTHTESSAWGSFAWSVFAETV